MTLEELLKLEQEATAGPWSAWLDPSALEASQRRGDRPWGWLVEGTDRADISAGNYDDSDYLTEADATFIAAIRNAAPALLDVASIAEAVSRRWWDNDLDRDDVADLDEALRQLREALGA